VVDVYRVVTQSELMAIRQLGRVVGSRESWHPYSAGEWVFVWSTEDAARAYALELLGDPLRSDRGGLYLLTMHVEAVIAGDASAEQYGVWLHSCRVKPPVDVNQVKVEYVGTPASPKEQSS